MIRGRELGKKAKENYFLRMIQINIIVDKNMHLQNKQKSKINNTAPRA